MNPQPTTASRPRSTSRQPLLWAAAAFAIGIALNGIFVVVELILGVMSNSLALIADASHNFSDVLGLMLAWGASLLARRPPSGRFTS